MSHTKLKSRRAGQLILHMEQLHIWSVKGALLNQTITGRRNGFTRATLNGITMYCCYIPPRCSIEEFRTILDILVADAQGRRKFILAGDFNAWAREWGCRSTNARGKVLLESFAALDVCLLNIGNDPTFVSHSGSSIIDIAFSSSDLVGRISWEMLNIYTHSDHLAIGIEVLDNQEPVGNRNHNRVIGWKKNSFDKEMFTLCMEDIRLEGSAEQMAKQLIRSVTHACNMSMERRKPGMHKRPVFWWNERIAQIRRECTRARRRFVRTRGRAENEEYHTIYKRFKKNLKVAIRQSKRSCFLDICDELEGNPFGLAYKVVMKRLKSGKSFPMNYTTLNKIVAHLFPRQIEPAWLNETAVLGTAFDPVTSEEVLEICSKLKINKAPGLDGISNLIVRETVYCRPDQVLKLINRCLEEGIFPDMWKRQRLVLLPKGNNPPDDPSSYRPLCMIDTFGKLLESVICARLQGYVDTAGGLSEMQFGFRKARSTIDAIHLVTETAKSAIRRRSFRNPYCVVVTLDVKNAFNMANWEKTVLALQRLNIPHYLVAMIQDYFRHRILIYDTDRGLEQYQVTGGVPQGSVLGPLLWNIMYDGILKLRLPSTVKIVGFADDVALVAVAENKMEAEASVNCSVQIVKAWLAANGLALAEHKTEVVLITSRRVKEYVNIQVGDCSITSKDTLKYLGVVIDSRLSFRQHIEYVEEKAGNICKALARIMPNTRGPKFLRRKMLAAVIRSVILYAAPIWADCLQYKSYRDKIVSVYRLTALRVCCGYRTISDEAAFVIAGMIPIDILAKESMMVYYRDCLPTEARDRSLEEWQRRWSGATKGRWTHSMIPNLREWLQRSHGDINFHLAQFLSGHGPYREYLHRFGLCSSPVCPHCDGVIQDAGHVFFECRKYANIRGILQIEIGTVLEVESIVGIMLSSESEWNRIDTYVRLVLRELRRDSQTIV